MKGVIFIICLWLPAMALATPCADDFYNLKSSKEYSARLILEDKVSECIDKLSDKIESGDSQAIVDGVSIFRMTDGGWSTSIIVSLASALPKNPGVVLSNLKNNTFLLERVCGIPFIEPKMKFVHKYYIRARNAINKLDKRNAEIKKAASFCMTQLNLVRFHPVLDGYE